MKKGLLTCICALLCLSAVAQWKDNPSEALLGWPDGKVIMPTKFKLAKTALPGTASIIRKTER